MDYKFDTRLISFFWFFRQKDHEISLQTNPDFSWRSHSASSKKGFVKLVESRPNVVNYIRKLTYKARSYNDDDQILSSILSNFLPTISRLNCLAINAFHSDWDTLDSSLTSAFLHLMRFPTINHIDLSNIINFPISSLPRSVNLHRLDMDSLSMSNFDHPGIVIDLEMILNSILRIPTCRRRSCYMLKCKMDDQLSTSWILDASGFFWWSPKMSRIFDIYCRMPSYLKNSIYQFYVERF